MPNTPQQSNIDRSKPNWMIHMVKNGVPCMCCGKIEYPYLNGFCDAHSFGLGNYNHLEFQIVLDIDPKVILYILNEFGFRVRSGYCFEPGRFVDGIFEDCPVRLDMAVDDGCQQILRVIIPDSQNHWPEDPNCEEPYKWQTVPLALLKNPEYRGCS